MTEIQKTIIELMINRLDNHMKRIDLLTEQTRDLAELIDIVSRRVEFLETESRNRKESEYLAGIQLKGGRP